MELQTSEPRRRRLLGLSRRFALPESEYKLRQMISDRRSAMSASGPFATGPADMPAS